MCVRTCKSMHATSRKQAGRCLGRTALYKNNSSSMSLVVRRPVFPSIIQQILPDAMDPWRRCKAKAAFRASLTYALEAGPYRTQPHTRSYHTAHSRAARCNYSRPKSRDVPMTPPPVALLLFHIVMPLVRAPERPASSFICPFPAAHRGPWAP